MGAGRSFCLLVTVCSWPAWVQNHPCVLSGQALPSCLCSGTVGWGPGIILPVGLNLCPLLGQTSAPSFPLPSLSFHLTAVSESKAFPKGFNCRATHWRVSYTHSGDSWAAKSKKGCASQEGLLQQLILSSGSGAASVILLF